MGVDMVVEQVVMDVDVDFGGVRMVHHGAPRNVAGEAAAFLQFLVDYYDSLPRQMLFLHSHRWAYHQVCDSVQ